MRVRGRRGLRCGSAVRGPRSALYARDRSAEREADSGQQQPRQHGGGQREAGHRQLGLAVVGGGGGGVGVVVVEGVVEVVDGVVVVVFASTITVPCMNGWIEQM